MKILHVTNYDNLGGAGIAAYRLHTALRKAGVDSRMLVRTKGSSDPFVTEVGTGEVRFADFTGQGGQPVRHSLGDGGRSEISSPKAHSLWSKALSSRLAVRGRGWLGTKMTRLLGMADCSLNILPTGLHKILNASDADVIHLHWINNEMISIKEIAKIKKPIVWTLHDMWAMCGAEHYSSADYWQTACGERSRTNGGDHKEEAKGYSLKSKVSSAVNHWIFKKKQKAWRNLSVSFVAPSNWMAEQVRQSELFADAPVAVISNCLDLEVFKPMDKAECRKKWNLPVDKKLILFGAFDPMDVRKGGDLLSAALSGLDYANTELVVFGAAKGTDFFGIKTNWMGEISSEEGMKELYNSANVYVCPSRIDNLPNTVLEARACGVPVVAFDVGGLSDLIRHRENGWLARPYEAEDFASGISWVLDRFPFECDPSSGSAPKLAHSLGGAVKKHISVYENLVTNH